MAVRFSERPAHGQAAKCSGAMEVADCPNRLWGGEFGHAPPWGDRASQRRRTAASSRADRSDGVCFFGYFICTSKEILIPEEGDLRQKQQVRCVAETKLANELKNSLRKER